MSPRQSWTLVQSAFKAWSDDYAPSMGAALSYYTLFSIAPLILIVVSVAGWFFGAEAARGEIVEQLRGLMGEEGAKAIEGLLASVSEPKKGLIASVLGLVVLLIGATTVFGELQADLDRIWRAPARKESSVWRLLRARMLSLGMILGIAFLLMVSLVFDAVLSTLGKAWGFNGWHALAKGINVLVSFGLTTVVFAMIYKLMPRAKIRWHDVWVGAAVTAGLFAVGKFLIGLYIGRAAITSSFGAAGSLVVVMVWVYYSAQIFLLGAEFTWVYAHAHGSRKSGSEPEFVSPAAKPNSGSDPDFPRPAPPLPKKPFIAVGTAALIGAIAGKFVQQKLR